MILVIGCNRQTKYEVLSFFFTGVPTPEEEARMKAERAQRPFGKNGKEGPLFSSHSYFTSKKCDACHQITLTQNFGGARRSGMPIINFGSGTAVGNSRLPLKKICVSCHENRSAPFASMNNLWLHAPATKHNCLVCHNPHRSKYPDLLKDETDKLCTMCHSEGLIRLTKVHQESKNCLECHNPHLGKDKFLLVKDYKEVRKLPELSYDTTDG
jgi:predicted CXXCH cytochrome family protein